VSPGVDVDAFRPRSRAEALRETAALLARDPDVARGRSGRIGTEVVRALERRDAKRLDALAGEYDQAVPDADAAERLRALAAREGPVAGYFGKLIPQKGVERLLAAARGSAADPAVLVVGFGTHREWLEALAVALRSDDAAALGWLARTMAPPEDPAQIAEVVPGAAGPFDVTFTGRLDHRYAPGALAAMDVLVVPSVMDEAFGMVAAEGAAAGALPLVARHSGLAEVARALEAAVARPGLFSFGPGPDAVANLRRGLDRLLLLPLGEREELRREVVAFVAREWSWRRTAERLLEAAGSA
jgi:glycosyltransferase involved in cell wall biosynthesis